MAFKWNKGKNNPMYGRKHTEETKQKMSEAKLKEGNSQWKGENVGYVSLHEWIRNHKDKIGVCQKCKRKGRTDWSSKTHNYTRDLDEYEELCRSCHMKYDYENGYRKGRGL